jgi:bifunctional non-homologous end joining protein LigD
MATTKTVKSAKKNAAARAKPVAANALKRPVAAADSVDAQLARYRGMRDFVTTAEPAGSDASKQATAKTAALPFVIQKHAASHLHYDFRLGWNGVLKSWAVAKGPSLVTKDRRLAVEVEDHPMEYGGFEGIIPKGQYGGGTVMVWDQGTWSPQAGFEDVTKALQEGSLKFELHGTKLKGKWTLIRMHARPAEKGSRWGSSSKPNWLLIKEHDEFERDADDPAITDEVPDSAVTGRTLDQIAAQEDHVWNSKDTAGKGQAWYRSLDKVSSAEGDKSKHPEVVVKPKAPAAPAQRSAPGEELASLPAESQPEFVPPQLAQEGSEPPDGAGWLHELKLDGYRVQARKSGGSVKLLTRGGLDWTHRMPAVAEAIAALAPQTLTLDGEVVVLGEDGNSSFADLQAAFQTKPSKRVNTAHALTYFAFDLLHLQGHSTRELALLERKRLLAPLMPADDATLRFSEHIEGSGGSMFRHACALHAEGIISKRASAPYASGRNSAWLKSKCLHEQEFVIGGYTLATDSAKHIGSLLLGYYDGRTLRYAGRTGTGFTAKTRVALLQQVSALKSDQCPFGPMPAAARRHALWAKPELVAQVRFATWTADDMVRQAAFLGLREDKPAAEVVREDAAPQPKNHHAAVPRPASVTTAPKASRTSTRGAIRVKHTAATGPLPAGLRLTNPGKVLDAETQLTKQQLALYYAAVADRMLPHIDGRPLSLVRCPEGSAKPCFFQKHVTAMLPPGIGSVPVPDKKTGKPESYITLDHETALVGLAQMGVLELHPWGSRNDDLEHPDRIVFDLDPDEALPWSEVAAAAMEVRKRLRAAGLKSFVKTTGGKGLHVCLPIVPKLAWPEIKQAAREFVQTMERRNPKLYLTTMTKAARRGKIYLDYLRNERGATSVAPYSPRARAGAAVSMPLRWSELNTAERPIYHTADLESWRKRLSAVDPWKEMLTLQQHPGPHVFLP